MIEAPNEQKLDSQQLEADAYNHLYQLNLYPTGVMYFCPETNITWQGNTYDFWGMTISGEGSQSDDTTMRPTVNFANFTYDVDGNPIRGVFSALNAQNKIEGATLIQRKVLKTHVASNTNIKTEKRWTVRRITALTPDIISLELRNSLDGPRFSIPARKFLPPEFPQVSLS